MRIVVLVVFFVLHFNSLAQAKSCTDSVLDLFYAKYTNLPEAYEVPSETRDCLNKSVEFKSVQDTVCKSDGTLTAEYEAYLGYAKDFKRTLIERDNSTSQAQRDFLNSELRAIENEWMVFGYRWELSPTLSIIYDLVSGECWSKVE